MSYRGSEDDNPRTLAACLGAPAEYWFPDFVDENGEEFFDDGTVWEQFGDTSEFYETGRAICLGCPIKDECLAGAMERRERFGCWGGLIPIERRRIERRERRKRLHERRRRAAAGLPPDPADEADDTLDSE